MTPIHVTSQSQVHASGRNNVSDPSQPLALLIMF
jgi:hypothetical protein